MFALVQSSAVMRSDAHEHTIISCHFQLQTII